MPFAEPHTQHREQSLTIGHGRVNVLFHSCKPIPVTVAGEERKPLQSVDVALYVSSITPQQTCDHHPHLSLHVPFSEMLIQVALP